MLALGFKCSRCLLERAAPPDARFCPRCGLTAAGPDGTDAVEITIEGQAYRVLDRIAAGSLCNVYRCRFSPVPGGGGGEVEGVLKVARDARANAWLANEADVLRRLRRFDPRGRFAPFLPGLRTSFHVADADDAADAFRDSADGAPAALPRGANVMANDPAIRSPDELYTLAEVRAAHPAGLDGRDVAWVWRRLLAVLDFAHAVGIAHGAVLPPHVLVEPREHKLVLVDWCSAAVAASRSRAAAVPVVTGAYLPWYRRQGAARRPPDPFTDVAMGARCMIELLGGDPVGGDCPPSVEPALARHFQRCLGAGGAAEGAPAGDATPHASRLLHEFDRLIEVLWGPRKFRALAMPPKPLRRH